MASVTSKDIPEEFNMFGEIFTLYKKYYTPENSDKYWNDMVSEFRALTVKYNNQLSIDLSIACMDAIKDRVQKVV